MTQEELLAELEQCERIETQKLELVANYVDTHKIEYLTPLPHQQSFIDNVRRPEIKTSLIVGANQIGKTVICANIAGAYSLDDKRRGTSCPSSLPNGPGRTTVKVFRAGFSARIGKRPPVTTSFPSSRSGCLPGSTRQRKTPSV
jgi:hypothetical protein